MLDLAKRYAANQDATILAHHVDGDTIIFVLSSGPKLRMTQAELEAALEERVPAPPADNTPSAPPKPKIKSKGVKQK